MTAPDIVVPYVIARSKELVKQQRMVFVQHRVTGACRLSYANPRTTDYVLAGTILRARVRVHMGGEPMWRMLNTRRQWECMEDGLCQVCGKSALDQSTGRYWWVVASTGFWITGPANDQGVTNAPPTCRDCIPYSQQYCPKLREHNTIYTVGAYKPVSVLAHTFVPGKKDRAVKVGHNIEIPLDDPIRMTFALATQLVVELHDLKQVELP